MNIMNIPDGQSGNWKLETFYLEEQDPNELLPEFPDALKVTIFHRKNDPGWYKRLTRDGRVVMSNTQHEMEDHRPFIENAQGDVLIAGLGLGMALSEILKKDSVKSVTVVEKSIDVYNLVASFFLSDPRVRIVIDDIHNFEPFGFYDCAWFDIWDDVDHKNLEEMKQLEKKWQPYCGWIGFWSRPILEELVKYPVYEFPS